MVETVRLDNVTFKWCQYLTKRNTEGEYASNKYQVDVIISKEDKKKLEAFKVSKKQVFKELEDGTYKICLKSDKKPQVLDASTGKKPMEETKLDSLGNGSKGFVLVNIFNSKGANFMGLGKILITDYKKYEGSDAFEDIEITEEISDESEDIFGDDDEELS